MPIGYNMIIGMQGDVGTTEVYIQAPRYIVGIDLLANNTESCIGWRIDENNCGIDKCIVEKLYSEVEADDLVLLTWKLDQDLINHC